MSRVTNKTTFSVKQPESPWSRNSLLAFSFLRDGLQRMQDLCSSKKKKRTSPLEPPRSFTIWVPICMELIHFSTEGRREERVLSVSVKPAICSHKDPSGLLSSFGVYSATLQRKPVWTPQHAKENPDICVYEWKQEAFCEDGSGSALLILWTLRMFVVD